MLRPTTLTVLMLAVLTASLATAETKDDERARVFVPESESWSLGSDFDIFGEIKGGAKPQTAEIVKTLHDRCPELIVTRNEERADYVLVLEHEGGKIFLRKDNKYAVFNAEGDAIESGATRSLGNAIKDACAAILADWHAARVTEP